MFRCPDVYAVYVSCKYRGSRAYVPADAVRHPSVVSAQIWRPIPSKLPQAHERALALVLDM